MPANSMTLPAVFEGLWTTGARYRVMYGGRSSGKSTAAALHVLGAVQEGKRVLCAREHMNSIADSVHALLCDLVRSNGMQGTFTMTKVDIRCPASGGSVVYSGLQASSIDSIRSLAGVDICWVEEAQTLSGQSWRVLAPTIRKEGSYFIFTGNPFSADDVFLAIAGGPDSWSCGSSWRDLESVGALSSAVRQQKDLDFATMPRAMYDHVWEGKFAPMAAENALFSAEELDGLLTDGHGEGGSSFGLDVARFGRDRSALAIMRGSVLEKLVTFRNLPLTRLSEQVSDLARKWKPTVIAVDETGVGGGCVDMLRAGGHRVMPVNFAAKSRDKRAADMPTALWLNLRERVDNGDFLVNRSCGSCPDLLSELSTRGMSIDKKDRLCIERKDVQKKRIGGSPDLADAVIMAAYGFRAIEW